VRQIKMRIPEEAALRLEIAAEREGRSLSAHCAVVVIEQAGLDDDALRYRFPQTPWRTPVEICWNGKDGFGCRYCILRLGGGHMTARLFYETAEGCVRHILAVHG
jgi:hypothetical protein